MNTIFFGAKRAFHSTLHLTRKPLADMGLTSARFDMLTAISRVSGGLPQGDLRDMLGVTGATISRMLRSLQELGMVVRERIAKDRRRLMVRLTEVGRRLLRRASRQFIESGAIQLAVDSALAGPGVFEEDACIGCMEVAEEILWKIEAAFHRTASLQYPWHPDD